MRPTLNHAVTALGALFVWSLTLLGAATPLQDVLPPSGGDREIELTAGATYTGGTYLQQTAVVHGNGAVINLAAGPRTDINLQPGVTLTLHNVTITGGVGILLEANAKLIATDTTFTGTQKGVRSNTYSQVELTECVFQGQTEATIDGAGGTITLRSVDVLSGPHIVLFSGTNLDWEGGQFLGGNGYGINVQTAVPASSVSVRDVVFRSRFPGAIVANQFTNFTMERCEIADCGRGVDLRDSTGRQATFRQTVITGSGLNAYQRQDAIWAARIGTLLCEDLSIRDMRSGIIAEDVPTVTVRDSSIRDNRKNQVNMIRVSNGRIERCYFVGYPIQGAINVDDFDILYLEQSTVQIEDSCVIDAPDNGILAFSSTLTIRRCFVAGSRINGVRAERNLYVAGSQGSTLTVSDSTILNSQHQDLLVMSTSKLYTDRTILGTTMAPAYPSTRIWPPNPTEGHGVAFQALSPDFRLQSCLVHTPTVFGIYARDLTASSSSSTGQVRFCTLAGKSGDTPTREGVLLTDVGAKVAFSDNHIYGVPYPNRILLATGAANLTDFQRNWLGNPGDEAILFDGTGSLKAENDYFGASNGSSGIGGGSGALVRTTGTGTVSTTPFLTVPPMGTTISTMHIDAFGSGETFLETDGVSVRIQYAGGNNASPYDAVVGMTDYRTDSKPLNGLPVSAEGERRVFFNLWLDARLGAFMNSSGSGYLLLEIRDKSVGSPLTKTALTWDVSGSLVTKTSHFFVPSSGRTTAQYVFPVGSLPPTSTLALRSFSEGGSPQMTILGLGSDASDPNGDGSLDVADLVWLMARE